jgi:hypothetical protein
MVEMFNYGVAIQICIAGMAEDDSKSNTLLMQLIANSLFTPRQMAIISNQLYRQGRDRKVTSGAYYRQVKQSKDKVTAVLYSMVLLQATNVLKPESVEAISRLAAQLNVILASEGSDILDNSRIDDVMSVTDQLIKRVCNL